MNIEPTNKDLLATLLATIKEDWPNVDAWALRASYKYGMLDRKVVWKICEQLKALENEKNN